MWNAPHRLVVFNTCSLIVVVLLRKVRETLGGSALREDVCHWRSWGWALRVSNLALLPALLLFFDPLMQCDELLSGSCSPVCPVMMDCSSSGTISENQPFIL